MNNKVTYDATIDEQMESRSQIEYVRDETNIINTMFGPKGKITSYKYKIYVHNKPSVEGELTLKEMNDIYSQYSIYGANLTQREVSRNFQIPFRDFRRIIKAFNITKSSAPLAPHIIEEKSIDEQEALLLQNKENVLLKRIEKKSERELQKRLDDKELELYKLKKSVTEFKEFLQEIKLDTNVRLRLPSVTDKDKAIIVYISDMHVGAEVSSTSIYNNTFNEEVARERLMEKILPYVKELTMLTKATSIIVCNVGDSLDGYNAQTTRGGHLLPQNMSNREQFRAYTQLMLLFFTDLSTCGLFSSIEYYSVSGGNHDGDFGYFANKALEGYLKILNPNIKVRIFEKFIESFTFNEHTFVVCHGKDDKDMFKNMPLVINDKVENQISEYLYEKDIRGKVHFVKGDLHQSATTYAKRFRYKSVGSFFGSSEWIHKNFGNTKACCDIDVVNGENIIETRIVLN